jgi:hypothetical protein
MGYLYCYTSKARPLKKRGFRASIISQETKMRKAKFTTVESIVSLRWVGSDHVDLSDSASPILSGGSEIYLVMRTDDVAYPPQSLTP